MKTPHFLLVGNGLYLNRGCEAIVRGTMVILRHEFGEDFRVTLATVAAPELVAAQAAGETDPLITHVALAETAAPRWTGAWWRQQLARRLWPVRLANGLLDRSCDAPTVGLQVGGDNFTLDYGRPVAFMQLDEHLRGRKIPVVLWGASVGPFEADPAFAPAMFAHLGNLEAILVREHDSFDYLVQHGLGARVHCVADPAFWMAPVEPAAEKLGCLVPAGMIGLNLSPLMAKYVTAGNLEAWVRLGADIVQGIVETTRRDVVLIPHVTSADSDDHAFLGKVLQACSRPVADRVCCLGAHLSAAETKAVIARCAVFAGARTHATIAAISSGVPTLSLAYSRKARGLNQDIFGSQDYCLQPGKLTPARIVRHLYKMLGMREAIAEHIRQVLPDIRKRALLSGSILRSLVSKP